MLALDRGRTNSHTLRICLACAGAAGVEVVLYLSYRGHDARFHWLTHFLIGASAALLLMAAWAWHARRPARLPLVWILIAHLYAMFPDVLFRLGTPHEPWMDLFLAHISSHFIPGRNITWLAVFAVALGVYLAVIDRRALDEHT